MSILISQRFVKRIKSQGSEGSRIQLRSLSPYRRTGLPFVRDIRLYPPQIQAEDIVTRLDNLLTNCNELTPNDCVIVLGDLNCELQCNVQGYTDR